MLFPEDHCKAILGNSPVNGSEMEEPKERGEALWIFEKLVVKFWQPESLHPSCIAVVNDMYCHHYF